MGNLSAFLADPNPGAVSTHRTADSGSARPKGNYIAVALVVAGSLPLLGRSYSYGTVPTTVTLDGSTIVAALKDLAYNGKAWFFGDGVVNGKSGKPKEMTETTAYGSRIVPRTTGEVAEAVDFAVKDSFLNIDFWNSLRSGALGPLDVYFFTNRTVQELRYETEEPVFNDIGSEIAGEFEKDIAGGFKVSWTCERGQLSPWKGVKDSALKFELMRYSFAAAAPAPAGLVLVPGTTNRYTLAAATAGKIKRGVNEPGAVRFSIFKNTNESLPSTDQTTIDTDTGEVNIPSSQPTGRYLYTVTAENNVGVFGTYTLEIVKA